MTSLELPWLVSDPGTPSELKAIANCSEAHPDHWPDLVRIAQKRLSSLDVAKLDRHLRRLFPEPPSGLSTRPIRLALLSSSTVDVLLPAIRVGALRRGLHVTIYTPGYNQYRQELMDKGSALHGFAPDVILFALDPWHLFDGANETGDHRHAAAELDRLCGQLAELWRMAADGSRCRVIHQTALPVFPDLMGNNEHRLPNSRSALLAALNARLRTLAPQCDVDLLAIDAQVVRDGLRAWHDPVLWHRAKHEVHPQAAPLYGDLVARLLAARQGRSAKCLVLDLDNTIWGGVIGDDGLEGIRLGPGSAVGEAYAAFQRHVLALGRRGVILAICSKNDVGNAYEAFDRHPEMILRRSDIATFAVNWTDKATNLRAIAQQLNIGLDALVFVDDNPFERNIVRRELPMVSVPELPDDVTFYADCLADAGYFEVVDVTGDDLARADQYQANLQRADVAAKATDLQGYLASLDMELRWARCDRVNLTRVVQLVNKTNQFNLTTRRYAEGEVEAMIADQSCICLYGRLVDAFGDNGIITVLIGRLDRETGDLVIETWLMSCRVLGRQVEVAVLNVLAGEARRSGARRLVGEYRPTAKNAMVKDHYEKLGFRPGGATGPDGSTSWHLALADFEDRDVAMRIVQA